MKLLLHFYIKKKFISLKIKQNLIGIFILFLKNFNYSKQFFYHNIIKKISEIYLLKFYFLTNNIFIHIYKKKEREKRKKKKII